MLDKNPKIISDENLSEVMKIIESNTINSLMYSDPFLKIKFIEYLISKSKTPVIYLDFDLLFSGYIASNILSLNSLVEVFQPDKNNWDKTLKSILVKISEKKFLLIIDSLNGLFNLYTEKKDSGRLVNSIVMLLTCISNMSKSSLVLTSMSRKNKDGWVLSITGRKIIKTNALKKIYLEKSNSTTHVKLIDEDNNSQRIYGVPIRSEMF